MNGFFEAEINGKRVSYDVLVPAWSNYEPRVNRRILYPINDTMTPRIYYMEYDVTQIVKEDLSFVRKRMVGVLENGG